MTAELPAGLQLELRRIKDDQLIARLDAHDMEQAQAAGPARPQACAHLRLLPLTGRKHQLRAQLAALGWPIVGDRIYPVLQPPRGPEAPDDGSAPLQLLARELAFDDPLTGQRRCFASRRVLSEAAASSS